MPRGAKALHRHPVGGGLPQRPPPPRPQGRGPLSTQAPHTGRKVRRLEQGSPIWLKKNPELYFLGF